MDWRSLLAATSAQAAQSDYFLKIAGIPGESTADGHKDEIQIESFSWGASNPALRTGGGGGGAGKVSMQDFHFTMRTNSASPPLFLATMSGQSIPEVTLGVRRGVDPRTPDYLQVKLTNVMVSSFQAAGSGGEENPAESISFNFTKIEFKYTPITDDGTVKPAVTACWDLATAKKC